MVLENKTGGWSKTKIGTLLVGIGAVAGTLGGWLTGSLEPMSAFQALLTEVGVVLGIFGIRDIPILQGRK
jgi:hypothetical protein